MKKIVFTGGGSAGHVVPNVALMEELLSKEDYSLFYVGTNGIERDVVEEWGVPFYALSCPKLIRKGGWQGCKQNAKIPVAFARAVKESKRILQEIQPNVVFSKGGYVALPVVFAAHKLRIPVLAHESDLSLGLANKISARFCQNMFTSFPETAKTCKRGVYSGAPMKRSLFTVSRVEARQHFRIPLEEKVLLVFGGGSGSQAINEALRNALPNLCEKYTILHICGKGNRIQTQQKNYHQFEFISYMGMAYACADLVLSRSGSGTTFEVMALKKPTLFVPLIGQTRGDQWQNASYFEKRGLCRILPQERLHDLEREMHLLDKDEGLKNQLSKSRYSSGNAVILKAIDEVCREE